MNQTFASFQNQIAQQQIFYLINQMEEYHANNQNLFAQIQKASEMNQRGSVQEAASLLYVK